MTFNKSKFYYNIESETIEHFTMDDLFTGPLGDSGRRGIPGSTGVMGFKGQSGDIGLKGDKGNIGPKGPIGPLGIGGNPGLPGPKGKQGIRGIRGDRGKQGLNGPIGERGPQGSLGYTGPSGIRGSDGDTGPKGPIGSSGYKGMFSFKYNKCNTTPWTKYAATNNTITCEKGTVATKIETKCGCGNGVTPENYNGTGDGCGFGKTSFIERDCQHRLTCCPYDLYDIGEPESMIKTRMFYGSRDMGEERLLNKSWVTLKPRGLNKIERDYPDGFFETENMGGAVKIITNNKDKYQEIVYAEDCKSKFCSKVGQHCIDNKICTDDINIETGCLKPPCWHKISDPVDSCTGTCEMLGQQCTDNKICSMQTNENCDTPPCWNPIPLLDKCPGKRCPIPGQQCSLGSTKYNMTGFVCKDEVNELPANNISEWCREPPCWHNVSQYTNECESEKCKIVGQKCGTEDKYNKICLDKSTDSCLNPPCWHNVDNSRICSRILFSNQTPVNDDGDECPKSLKLDADGKEIKNKFDEPLYEYNQECKDKWDKNKLKEKNVCKPIELLDESNNKIKDSEGNPIMVMGKCKFEGNCSNIGRRCTVNGKSMYECMDKYKTLDAITPSFDKSKCNNPPCWVPIEDALDPKLMYLRILNNNEFKNEAQINALNGLEKAEVNLNVYQFTEDDRKGTITFSQLHNYMQANWIIFEANSIRENALIIWKMFTGSDGGRNTMNYTQFSTMMRKLRVETFKYRDDKGRIYPKFMPDDIYDSILGAYKSSDPNDKRY